jgi:hypothetical protein
MRSLLALTAEVKLETLNCLFAANHSGRAV